LASRNSTVSADPPQRAVRMYLRYHTPIWLPVGMNRIVGLDYGTRRLGFAVSDDAHLLAVALRIITVKSDKESVAAVREVCEDVGTDRVVIGLPLNMNGSRGAMAVRVEAFAERIRDELGLDIVTWDERLSTGLVERSLLEADMSRAKRKRVRDKLAAQVILQGFLDAQAARHGNLAPDFEDTGAGQP